MAQPPMKNDDAAAKQKLPDELPDANDMNGWAQFFRDPEWEAFSAAHANDSYATGYDVQWWKELFRRGNVSAYNSLSASDPEVAEAAKAVVAEQERKVREEYEREYGARDREVAKANRYKFLKELFYGVLIAWLLYTVLERSQELHPVLWHTLRIGIGLAIALYIAWILLAKVIALFIVRVRKEVDAKRRM